MRIIGNDPSVPRQTQEVASGTLPNGKPVIVNADGTVSVVGIGAASIGSAVIFENATTSYNSTAYDTTNDKIVISYRDSDNSNYFTAVVGTVSGTSISFGTPVVVASSYHSYQSIVFDSNAGKMVLASVDSGSSSHGKAVVGTVSGTSISFGSMATFHSGSVSSIGSAYDSTNNKTIIAFVDASASNHGKAIVGTVSGTSISFGSAATFNSGTTTVSMRSVVHDSSTGKTVIAYRDTGNSNQGTAVVGTVSSTSISFGSESIFETTATQDINGVYDSGNSKVNFFYMDGGDSDKGKAVIGTVSGTSISFTTPEVFYDAAINALSAVYDSNAASNVIGIRGASAYGYAIPITSDGSSFTVGSSTTITTNAYGTLASSAFDPDQKKVVFAYQDGDDSSKGKAQVYNTPATTLTSENYIGITRSGAASGAGAIIDTQGAIADNLSGLTAGQSYFVQTDGTLGTTAGSPSVFAGTAVSATKLIVKG